MLRGMVKQVYRPRRPKQSPLWQCLSRHFDAFQELYEERYQPRYGFLRHLGLWEQGVRVAPARAPPPHPPNGSTSPATLALRSSKSEVLHVPR